MFIASFPAGPWQTNCYVVATGPGTECVVIDPGMDAADGVREVVAQNHLKPVAVLLTHGHLDHMYSVTPLCSSYDSTCWIHPDDRALLADPLRAMSAETSAMLQQLTGARQTFVEPDEVREMVDGAVVEVAGVTFSCLHAPGHTAGSTMFSTPYEPDAEVATSGSTLPFPELAERRPSTSSGSGARSRSGDGARSRSGDGGHSRSVVFSGDVLFAGSIGRTDLPGGSSEAMLHSLRTKVLPLPDTAVVLPGHGPQTTMAQERATNPYLHEHYLRSTS
ncbi:MAG TPA: MBL fold metallo-hydrolase [Propionibacteriaceae bacterium]